jgi:hypothetical protein
LEDPIMVRDQSQAPPAAESLLVKWWFWLTSVMEFLKKTLAIHGFALLMFALTSFVLLFVPQIANIWWKLPYRVSSENLLIGVGFWIYVPSVALFYYVSFVILAGVGRQDVMRVVAVTCGLVLIFLLLAPAALSLWNDVFAGSTWASVAFYVLTPILTVLYFFSWVLLTQSEDSGDPPARSSPLTLPSPLTRGEGRVRGTAFTKWLLAERNRFWPARPKGDSKTEDVWLGRAFMSWPGCHTLCVLAIPMALANLLMLAINHLLCGMWIIPLARTVRKYPRICLGAAVLALLIAIVGNQVFAHSGTTVVYPASQGIFGLALLPLAALCVWIPAVAWHQPEDCSSLLDAVGEVSGRIPILLLTTSAAGEILWAAPSLPVLDAYFSYRLYTIWAAFHVCFCLVALGAWADVTHCQWRQWPMRALTLVGLVIAVLVLAGPAALEPSGQEEGRATWERATAKEATPDSSLNWYQHMWERLEAIEKKGKGPIVVIAASGGGSRAALFTSLVLEGLDKEAFPDIKDNKWSDRVLLVSSVSGGSLATAHLTFRKGRPLETVPFLRNSIQSELIIRFGTEYEDVRPSYKLEGPNKLQRTFAELYEADARDSDLQWILGSGSADAMCTDFMAPLLRGVMTFGLERGESVSQFWQQRLAWINPDDERPYHNLGHDPLRPLVVFNTTDARRGNRFLLGFPDLPRRMFTLHLGRIPSASVTVQGTLTANDPLDPKYNQPVKVHLVSLRVGQSYTFEMQRLDKSPPPK